MRVRFKKVAVLIGGWVFIVLGVVGLFLPILQGVFFLIIGLFILSSEYVWAHQLLQKLRNRFPKLDSRWEEMRGKAHEWRNRVFHHT